MQELFKKINEQMVQFAKDGTKLLKDENKSAGARSRKASLEITKLLKEWRKLSVKN